MKPRTLDATYRTRAIPTGSARHLSWLFAAPPARAPLLGVYALQAEWNALIDPRTERSAAEIKLAWWQEEMRRLADAAPVHPISLYLASLPGAVHRPFAPLIDAIDAAAVEVSGAPLELATDLEPHAHRLRAGPLQVAAAMSQSVATRSVATRSVTPAQTAAEADAGLHACTGALAVADYLARALEDYRREARAGRVVFAVDDLVAAGVDNATLAAERADSRLEGYLATVRDRAAAHYALVAQRLPRGERPAQRHLLVLAALGASRLRGARADGLPGLYLAWTTAQRAAR